jgi:hypothetical protein
MTPLELQQLYVNYILGLLLGAAEAPNARPQVQQAQRVGGQLGHEPGKGLILTPRQSNMFRRPGGRFVYHEGSGEKWALGDDPRRRPHAQDSTYGQDETVVLVQGDQPLMVDELPLGHVARHFRWIWDGASATIFEYKLLPDLTTAIDPEHGWYSLHGDIDQLLEWYYGAHENIFGPVPVADGVGVGPNFAYPYSAEKVNGVVRFHALELPNLNAAFPGDDWVRLGDIPTLEIGAIPNHELAMAHQLAAFFEYMAFSGRDLHACYYDGYTTGHELDPAYYVSWYKDSIPTPVSMGFKPYADMIPVETAGDHDLIRYYVTGTGGGYVEHRDVVGTAKARKYTFSLNTGGSFSRPIDRYQVIRVTGMGPPTDVDILPTDDYAPLWKIWKNGNGEVICELVDNFEDQSGAPSGSVWATGLWGGGTMKACVDMYYTYNHSTGEYTAITHQGIGYHLQQTWEASWYDGAANQPITDGTIDHQTGVAFGLDSTTGVRHGTPTFRVNDVGCLALIIVTAPTGIVADDIILVFIMVGGSGETTLGPLTLPTGFSLLVELQPIAGVVMNVYQKVSTGSEPTDYAFTDFPAGTNKIAGCTVYRGFSEFTTVTVETPNIESIPPTLDGNVSAPASTYGGNPEGTIGFQIFLHDCSSCLNFSYSGSPNVVFAAQPADGGLSASAQSPGGTSNPGPGMSVTDALGVLSLPLETASWSNAISGNVAVGYTLWLEGPAPDPPGGGFGEEDPFLWTFYGPANGRDDLALKQMRQVAKAYVIDPRDLGGGAMSVADLKRWWIMDYELAQLVPYTTTLVDPAAWNPSIWNPPELGVDLDRTAGSDVVVPHTRPLTGPPTVADVGTFDVGTVNAGIRPATIATGVHRIAHQETIVCNDAVTRTRGRIRTWYDDMTKVVSWYPMVAEHPDDNRIVDATPDYLNVNWPDDDSVRMAETEAFWAAQGPMLVDPVRGNIPRPGGTDTLRGIVIDDTLLGGFSADVIDAPGGELGIVVTPTEFIVSAADVVVWQGTWAEMLHPDLWAYLNGLAAEQRIPLPHYQFLHPDWPFKWGLLTLYDIELYARPLLKEDRKEHVPTDSLSRVSPVVIIRREP